MRNLETIKKEIDYVRLTVAKDRATLKVPLNTSESNLQKFQEMSEKINADLGDVDLTLRGCFQGFTITMFPKTKNKVVREKFRRKFEF